MAKNIIEDQWCYLKKNNDELETRVYILKEYPVGTILKMENENKYIRVDRPVAAYDCSKCIFCNLEKSEKRYFCDNTMCIDKEREDGEDVCYCEVELWEVLFG